MTAWLERLREGRCLLLDGAMGTELIARGLPPGHPPERWNVERPDDVLAVHRAYVSAGSEAIHTNTFGANAVRLARHGLDGHVAELNAAAVRLARAAGARLVIGDMGPTGEALPPVGRGDPMRWRPALRAQAEALAGAGVDAVHVETMTDLREALVALEAVRDVAPALPRIVSMSFEHRPRGFFTVMGNEALGAWRALVEAGASAVGANCTLESGRMRELAERAIEAGLPVVIQPNAPSGAEACNVFAHDLARLRGRALAIGGCCGTGPAFIAALSAAGARR